VVKGINVTVRGRNGKYVKEHRSIKVLSGELNRTSSSNLWTWP